MPRMSNQCKTEGCQNTVSKTGHYLCLSCWKVQKDSAAEKSPPAPSSASSPVAEGSAKYLSTTKIAEHFGIKPARANAILNELGWITRAQKGWTATPVSREVAHEKSHHQSGAPFVLWPPTILQSRILCAAVSDYLGNNLPQTGAPVKTGDAPQTAAAVKTHDPDDFRKKFPANLRATDGHFVRSRAEVLIDNFLYNSSIVHAYERKLPVEEDVYCDFYLPGGKVYIEFWGLENDPKYAARKKRKLEIYAKYQFNLIELGDNEIGNLDDHLPRLLLKHGIAVD